MPDRPNSVVPRSTAVRVPKAAEIVAAHIRRQIVSGELHEGATLPSEAAMAEQFRVSRPTLREAFRILESERSIEVVRGPRGGVRVLLPQIDTAGRFCGTLLQFRGTTMSDVHEARARIEATGVAMLAAKRTAADLRRLDGMLAEGEAYLKDADPLAYGLEHDLEFHRLLMELSDNQTMAVLLDMVLWIIESQTVSFSAAHRDDMATVSTAAAAQRAHVKLVTLIRAKDADKAVTFWRKHLASVKDLMVRDADESVLDVLP